MLYAAGLAAAGLIVMAALMAAYELPWGGSGIDWARNGSEGVKRLAVCTVMRGATLAYGADFTPPTPDPWRPHIPTPEPICTWQKP